MYGSGQTSIRIWRWFVKGCKYWAKAIASYGPYEPSGEVGRWYERCPPTYLHLKRPRVMKVIMRSGCPPDSSRGRHWIR